MKNILLLLLACLTFSFTNVNDNLKSKLLEVYTTEQTSQILKNDNQKKYYEVLIFKSYHTEEVIKKEVLSKYPVLKMVKLNEKDGSSLEISSIELIELLKNGKFNALKLNLERSLNETKSFRLENSKVIFHLLSHNQINKLVKQ